MRTTLELYRTNYSAQVRQGPHKSCCMHPHPSTGHTAVALIQSDCLHSGRCAAGGDISGAAGAVHPGHPLHQLAHRCKAATAGVTVLSAPPMFARGHVKRPTWLTACCNTSLCFCPQDRCIPSRKHSSQLRSSALRYATSCLVRITCLVYVPNLPRTLAQYRGNRAHGLLSHLPVQPCCQCVRRWTEVLVAAFRGRGRV